MISLKSDFEEWFTKVLDKYLKYGFLFDLVMGLIVISINKLFIQFLGVKFFLESPNLLSLITELLSSSIALAGFILAALAFVTTIKSGVKEKPKDESKSGLEFILNSENYDEIISTYVNSTIILVLSFVLFTLVGILISGLSVDLLFGAIVLLLIIVLGAIFRCLFILTNLIRLIRDHNNRSG